MRNRTKIVLAVVSIAVVASAWLLASSPRLDSNSRSLVEPSAAPVDNRQIETSDDLPEHSAEFAHAATMNTFGCSADYDSHYVDLEVMASALSKSDNPEHLLMAALYGPDRTSEARINTLLSALKMDPDNRLISWNLLYSCSMIPEAAECLDGTIEERAIEVDGGNGQVWATIAGFRADRGNMSGTLDAIKRATVAPGFSDYRTDHIELFARGLAAAENAPYGSRIRHAFGMQAALVSNERSIFIACDAMAPESAEWLLQCINLGERMEIDGRTAITVLLGQILQKRMYTLSGDKGAGATVEERLRRTTDAVHNGLPEDAEVLLVRDERILANYINEMATHGELRAIEYLHEEVERLRNLPGYDPC